ncbi:hypothetical protein [Sabulicella glaciei]|uniref:Uncharacterized protein n=1 Tax=Sabulicella glaciei TaxID=2984948 RepID=A0ABT3NTV8_9PROT|nr:hypothetical protein [Roseococcus sp. MDT2-1-1]MCW8085597.1 hypothetical protein [Roseococcus sp. MDT2-1-1]
MSDATLPTAIPHPEEMRAELDLRFGSATIHATARTTPAGIIAVGVLVSSILLSTAVLVRAARKER